MREWIDAIMFWLGWRRASEFDSLFDTHVADVELIGELRARITKQDKRIDGLQTEIAQLSVGTKPVPSKASDIKAHLIEGDRQKATEVKYRMLKQRTREVVDASVAVAAYLRRIARLPGRSNADVARLYSAADALHDPQYVGSLKDDEEGGA